MALFGGSKSTTKNTSEQIGLEGGGNIANDGSEVTIIDEFPETVAGFASESLALAGKVVNQAGDTLATLGELATREKTPLTELLPFIAVGAVVLVLISREF